MRRTAGCSSFRTPHSSATFAGSPSAGAVWLWDDTARRPHVGLADTRDEAQPLLSEHYYVRKALQPYAQLTEKKLANLLARQRGEQLEGLLSLSGDLADAQRLKEASDAAIAAHEKALAEARGRAQTLANETREKAAAAAEARRKDVDAKLGAKIADAEKTIAATRSTAMANVRGIASEAAAAIVERLTGIAPQSQEVADAVGSLCQCEAEGRELGLHRRDQPVDLAMARAPHQGIDIAGIGGPALGPRLAQRVARASHDVFQGRHVREQVELLEDHPHFATQGEQRRPGRVAG